MEESTLTPQEAKELQQYIGYGASWLGPALVSGEGCRVIDIHGKPYLDCTSQAWSLALGYNHPEVMEAAVAQMRTLAHARAGFPTIPRLLLAKRLAELCPGHLKKVVNAPTGSLAVEAAMKLALINRPEAHRFITFYHAYHAVAARRLRAVPAAGRRRVPLRPADRRARAAERREAGTVRVRRGVPGREVRDRLPGFFVAALFFTMMHVAVLCIATVPGGALSLRALGYLVVIAASVSILYREFD